MPIFRASELDRLMNCAGSTVLPIQDTRRPAARSAADWGMVCHSWKETGIIPGVTQVEKDLAPKLDKRVKACKIDRLRWWPEEGEHEIALAINLVTDKVMKCSPPPGQERDREYRERWKSGFDDRWAVGTLDFAMELVGVPWVDDLKTGRMVHYKSYECQQAFYVLGYVLWKYGELREARSTITHWPRYPLDQEPRRMGVLFSTEFLAGFWDDLKDLRMRILEGRETGTIDLYAGDHCTFCPSRLSCPTQQPDQTKMSGQKQETKHE